MSQEVRGEVGLRLEDLRRIEFINRGHPAWEGVAPYAHPVSEHEFLVLAVEHLKAKGAKVVDAHIDMYDGHEWLDVGVAPSAIPRRFLVVPLDGLED